MRKVSKKKTDSSPSKRPKKEAEMIASQAKMIGNVIRINDMLRHMSGMTPEVTFTSVVFAMADFIWGFGHQTEIEVDKLKNMFFDEVGTLLTERNNAEKGAS